MVLGWANNASASSSPTVNSWSSDWSDLDSEPRFRYGPYRPLVATISSPLDGIDADHPGEGQHPKGVLERHRGRIHAGQQRGGGRLPGGFLSRSHLHVGAEPPGPHHDWQSRPGIGSEDPL